MNLVGEKRIAAVFVEPIAGSTGVIVPPRGYLERLREICTRYGILLVFDEVICGFGRTGEAFAAMSFGVTPDLITMAKALTNGAQPMGAVAVRDGHLSHHPRCGARRACRSSSTATPTRRTRLPARPAWRRSTSTARSSLFAKGRDLSGYFLDKMFALGDLPAVADVRGFGTAGRRSRSRPARPRACAATSCRRSSTIAACT